MIDPGSPADPMSHQPATLQPEAAVSTVVNPPPWTNRERFAVTVVLVLHAVLLWISTVIHSPCWDEIGHLPAGIAHWQSGIFDLYRVNPPLVRTTATLLPYVMGMRLEVEGASPACPPWRRGEFVSGSAWIRAEGAEFYYALQLARGVASLFSVACGWLIYRFARNALGIAPAGIAMVLWCTSPLVLGHGSLITPDVGSATTALLAIMAIAAWSVAPSWGRTALAGAGLGLALLTKFTNILLVLAVIGVLAYRLYRPQSTIETSMTRRGWCLRFAAIAVFSAYVVNLGYGFERFGTRLGEYRFISRFFRGEEEVGRTKPYGNRFAGTMLGAVPIPLPENYLNGIDVQKRDFEMKMMSYLRGEWQRGGWYHYYVYGILVKEPLGMLALLALALVRFPFLPRAQRTFLGCWALLPALGFLLFVSSQIGFNHHLRYILPAYPFLFLFAAGGALPGVGPRGHWWPRIGILLCLVAAVESLSVYPHSMSYFNLAVGGPINGPKHLHSSNIDWGQDLLGLAKWAKAHPDARPLRISISHGYESRDLPWWDAGVSHGLLTVDECKQIAEGKWPGGWVAVSVSRMYDPPDRDFDRYRWFREHEPDARIGYGIRLYKLPTVPAVDQDGAND